MSMPVDPEPPLPPAGQALRIMLVTPELPGCGPSFGVGAYVEVLARGLQEAGHHVLVCACTERGRFSQWPGHPPVQQDYRWAPPVLRPWLDARWLRTQGHWFGAEIVEVSNWGGLGAFLQGPWRTVTRISTPVGLIKPKHTLARLTRWFHRRWEARTIQQAGRLLTHSQAMAALMPGLYGRNADAVIPLACTVTETTPVAGAKDVLFVGRMEQRKGIDVLLAAWREVHQHGSNTVLHLVGSLSPQWTSQQLLAAGGDGVRFHDYLDDHQLANLRRSCAIQVVPSRFETFGLVVPEAWAGGQAVIVSDQGALPETLGDAGVVAAGPTAATLAAALQMLLGDAGLRDRLAALGRERLRSWCSLPACVSATLAAYRQALADPGPAPAPAPAPFPLLVPVFAKATYTPRVSVVTPTRNRATALAACLDSVTSQAGIIVEHVVIDAASGDGTCALLKSRGERITWISESDRGIADGFNKGIGLAQADLIALLGDDDRFTPGALAAAAAFLDEHPAAGFCFGDCTYLLAGRPVQDGPADSGYASTVRQRMPAINHPTMIVRRSAYERCGLFRPELRYAMDHDLLLRFHRAGITGIRLPRVQALIALDGVSNRRWTSARWESAAITIAHGAAAVPALLRFVGAWSRHTARRMVATLLPRALKDRLRRRSSP